MRCAECNHDFTDGSQCGACKKTYDFNCAGISEANYRKMKRLSWRCAACSRGSSSPVAKKGEPVTLEAIMERLNGLTAQLTALPALVEDVKSVKQELQDVRSSCSFMSSQLDDFVGKLKLVDEANNVEIKGVPMRKSENLFQLVGAIGAHVKCSIPVTQINYVSRLPTFNSNEKSILVSFVNRYAKEDFVAAARSVKTIQARDIGFADSNNRIYVNDHLSSTQKKLLNDSKNIAKNKGYQFVWVKFAKIHVRKNDTSPVYVINSASDLNKLT
ncbi:unnamed protein product [Plutella xylostella]|uniref:(diamondback moth) hypothetical protein n=1 Tax=Plutella xylostella TaxID=51655 RepID=A0A8S4GBL4_PLUXY|nr:unnamed protein product [Plutella xylostella]